MSRIFENTITDLKSDLLIDVLLIVKENSSFIGSLYQTKLKSHFDLSTGAWITTLERPMHGTSMKARVTLLKTEK